MTVHFRPIVGTLMGVALVVGGGCGKAAEKVSEAATERAVEAAGGGGGDVDIDSGSGGFTMETEDATVASGSGEIPDEWPTDIPLPTLRDVSSSQVTDTGSGALITVSGTASFSSVEAEEFFADALQAWTQATRSAFDTDGVQTVQVGYQLDDRTLVVGIVEDGGGVILSLTYAVDPS